MPYKIVNISSIWDHVGKWNVLAWSALETGSDGVIFGFWPKQVFLAVSEGPWFTPLQLAKWKLMHLLYLSSWISQVVSGEEQGEGEECRVVDEVRDEKVVSEEVGAERLEDDVPPEAEVVQAEHAEAAKEDGKYGVLHNECPVRAIGCWST